jgi:REP element-mobilizing transposase RayT
MDETLFHHVTGRGVVRRTLFHDERDYARFLKYLATAVERFGWRCHSYCLIPNHYHLLLAEAIRGDAHLLVAFRYIALNPVRAGLCERPADWPWSSYRATAGLEHEPPWLEVEFARALFEPYGGFVHFCNPVATELQPGC